MSAPNTVHRGPTSLMEEARLRGANSHWHNLLHDVWRLTGPLDVDALRDAWWRVCLRHDAMRRTYASPTEAITHPDALVEVQILSADSDEEALSLLRRRLGSTFDLTGGAFARIVLVQRDEQRHLLGVSIDHIITDQMSWQHLMRDFSAQYTEALEHTVPDTAESTTYRDYALALRNELDYARGRERREFWTAYAGEFGSIPPPFSLLGSSTAEPDMTTLVLDLPHGATAQVRSSASQARATPFSVVAAAVLSSMRGVSGDEVVGLFFNHHGRMTPESYSTVGLFARGAPLHLRATSCSQLDMVRDVFHRSLQTSDHIRPFDITGDHWSAPFTSSRAAGVFLEVTEGDSSDPIPLGLTGVTIESIEIEFEGALIANDTLVFACALSESRPQLALTYDRNLFHDEPVNRLLRLSAARAVERLNEA